MFFLWPTEVECPDVQVANGVWAGGSPGPHGYQATVTFKCNIGFFMDGPASITCQSDSKWSPQPPVCKGRSNDSSCSLMGPSQNFNCVISSSSLSLDVQTSPQSASRLLQSGKFRVQVERGGHIRLRWRPPHEWNGRTDMFLQWGIYTCSSIVSQ